MRLGIRPLNVSAVLEAALDTVRPAATAKEIRLESALDPRAGSIMGDPGRLQQVAWNLLMNAVKFTPNGGRVQLQLQRVNWHIEITVNDTGEGIAPEELPQLFERFRQLDTVSAGTRRRANRLGPGERQAGIAARHSRAGGDDDLEGLEFAGLVLVNAGAEARTAPSVAAAMAMLEEWPPNVLITDLEMSDEGGFGLLWRARRAAMLRGQRLPALALTAYGRGENRVRVLAAGFNLQLAKPADPTELVLAVASLTGRTG